MPTQNLLRLFSFADVDAEKRVDDSLLQIWKLKFWSLSFVVFVQTETLKFGILLLMLG